MLDEKVSQGDVITMASGKEYLVFATATNPSGKEYAYLMTQTQPIEFCFAEQMPVGIQYILRPLEESAEKMSAFDLFQRSQKAVRL